MQMAYSEDELDSHMEVIANGDAVPKILDDEVPLSEVQYNGDLKKKDDLSTFTKKFDETKR